VKHERRSNHHKPAAQHYSLVASGRATNLNNRTSLQAKRLMIAAVCVVAGVPVLLILWSKAAQLLNAKSDFSVLIGYAMILATLIAIGAFVYFALTKFIFARGTGNSEETEKQSALKDGVQPKSLFSETTNSVEHINETDESKLERK
jgi:formate hydrogenlyase subunit 3/multisubunit Na+/H+ antiporter MnhD subunit